MSATTAGLRFYDILSAHAEERGERVAVIDGDLRLTWREVAGLVVRLSKSFLARGVQRGDRIAVMAPAGLLFWASLQAAASIGAIWVGLNPRYRRNDFSHILEDAQPALVLTISPFEGRDYEAELLQLSTAPLIVAGDARVAMSLEVFLKAGTEISHDALSIARKRVLPQDPVVVVYTSGTTGRQKGAMLSQEAMAWSAQVNVDYYGADCFACAVCAIPVNHVGGLDNVCLPVMVAGGCLVFHPRLELADIFRLSQEHQATHAVASPTLFSMVLDAPEYNFFRLPHLKLVVFGGAQTPLPMLQALRPQSSAWFSSVYGQTETCGMITATPRDAALADASETFGWPLPGVELRVVDKAGQPVADGETGELLVRGPCLMSGYRGLAQATRETLGAEGWLRTGDLCIRREDGAFAFRGRLKEMFKSGGYNIYPPEIEAALLEHPAVGLAAVLPAPDPRFQEIGWAFIQPKAGETVTPEDLGAFLRDRIANYKAPKRYFVEAALPLLANTKIDKQALRARVEALHAAETTSIAGGN